jgi:hypothetical protein
MKIMYALRGLFGFLILREAALKPGLARSVSTTNERLNSDQFLPACL